MDYIFVSTGALLSYIGYLEINPKIRNVWLRVNSNGDKVFYLDGILSMLKLPFTDLVYWKLENFDLNWIVINIGFLSTYHIFKELNSYLILYEKY